MPREASAPDRTPQTAMWMGSPAGIATTPSGSSGAWANAGTAAETARAPAAPMMPSFLSFMRIQCSSCSLMVRRRPATGSRCMAAGRRPRTRPDGMPGEGRGGAATQGSRASGDLLLVPRCRTGTRTLRASTVAAGAFAYDSHRRLECKTSERPGACAGSDPSGGPAITRCGALGASPRPAGRARRRPASAGAAAASGRAGSVAASAHRSAQGAVDRAGALAHRTCIGSRLRSNSYVVIAQVRWLATAAHRSPA